MKTAIGVLGAMLFLAMIAVVPGTARAEALSLEVTQDAYVDAFSPTSNFGTGASIDIGFDTAPSSIRRRALIQWDLSPLAEANAQEIIRATASWECGQIEGSFTWGWHLITSAWAETVVTHNTQPSFQATALVNVTSPAICPAETFVITDITPLVSAWFFGTNNGMIGISTNESLDAHVVLRSREFTASPPTLSVVFAPLLPTAGIEGSLALAVGFFTIIMIAVIAKFGLDILGGSMTREKFIANLMIMAVVTLIFIVAWGIFLATDP